MEHAEVLSANLLEAGSFRVQVGRRFWRLQPGDIFFTYPGLTYRCRHDDVANDRCLSISYSHDFAPRFADRGNRHCIPIVMRAGNRLKYLFGRMLAQLRADPAALAVEGTAADVLHALQRPSPRRAQYRDAQLAWYAERIDAARDLLDGQFNRQHTLASLARNAGMSTFHFARIFSELTGNPPHRYLLERRLDRAAWHLRQGASVTETCFAVGFQNLSHFIRSFERRFGFTPAAYSQRRRN
ncbi:MAG: AraC family transcriptional regulator [Acidobacteriales bacterium]|nr:AraC family transcriptional regulator [Terriglobales bacterium]